MLKLLAILLAVGALALGNDGHRVLGAPDLSPPVLAPGRVTDLRVSAVTDSSAVLTWTEVPSGTTVVSRYVVRYGLAAGYSWGSRPDVLTGGCGAPVYGSTTAGGRVRSCVLSGLSPHLAYQVQVVAYTGNLSTTTNFGLLSNVADVITAQRIGPMLVVRPPMFLDTVAIAEASLPYDFGPRRYPLHGKFPAGDRVASFYDSTGTLAAFAYCLLVRP